MTTDNLPVRRVTKLEIPVATDADTGEFIRHMYCKLPMLSREMEVGYPRGTHLKLEIEVRVQSVLTDEHTSGKYRGEAFRMHTFAYEDIKIVGVYSADEVDPGVGGGLAASNPTEQEMDDRPESEEGDGNDDRGTDRGAEHESAPAGTEVSGGPVGDGPDGSAVPRGPEDPHDPGF